MIFSYQNNHKRIEIKFTRLISLKRDSMANKIGKNESPSCACGKADLYEEWLKQNKKDAVSAGADPASNDLIATEDAGKPEPKPERRGK